MCVGLCRCVHVCLFPTYLSPLDCPVHVECMSHRPCPVTCLVTAPLPSPPLLPLLLRTFPPPSPPLCDIEDGVGMAGMLSDRCLQRPGQYILKGLVFSVDIASTTGVTPEAYCGASNRRAQSASDSLASAVVGRGALELSQHILTLHTPKSSLPSASACCLPWHSLRWQWAHRWLAV